MFKYNDYIFIRNYYEFFQQLQTYSGNCIVFCNKNRFKHHLFFLNKFTYIFNGNKQRSGILIQRIRFKYTFCCFSGNNRMDNYIFNNKLYP